MLNKLVDILVCSKNEAADDVLLECLRLGAEPEKNLALSALLRRKSLRGLCGLVGMYKDLPQAAQMILLANIKTLHPALRECGRSHDPQLATAAMKLIALGRQGKLTYLLSEGLHSGDDQVSRAAVEAIVAMARWVATETRRLHRQPVSQLPAQPTARISDANDSGCIYRQLIEERAEVEQAVARAMDVHRGKYGQELLRASLLLADWPGSKTLAILHTAKHGGQSAMIRRLQQPPESEHLEAFLLGASHGNLRAQFGNVFSHIADPPVLDALLRKTHWLKDLQLQLCMHQVSRGVWWGEAELDKDISRRDDEDISRIGEWIAASGVHDVVQDERLERLRIQIRDYLPGRLRLLRLAMRRPKGASVALIRSFFTDGDERLARMAVREIVRRRPADYENILIQLMGTASPSVRRVIGRSVGQVGFDKFWDRYDHLDKVIRKAAGRAMFKALPDSAQRLERCMRNGPVEQRIKAIAMAQDLGVGDSLAGALMQTCQDPNPRLRSKAISLLGELKTVAPDVLLEKALNDSDPRVRANAIEVLEAKRQVEYVPLLTVRARSSTNRERANAIKAMHRMRVSTASSQLQNMLQDERPEHRISAMWALKQIGWWQMLQDVGKMARFDTNLRVRRYAMAVLRGVADMVRERREKAV